MLRMLTREAFERRTAGGARTPVYRELLADRETPVSVLSRVADGEDDVFLLESVYNGDRKGRYSYLGLGGGVANPSAPFAAAKKSISPAAASSSKPTMKSRLSPRKAPFTRYSQASVCPIFRRIRC